MARRGRRNTTYNERREQAGLAVGRERPAYLDQPVRNNAPDTRTPRAAVGLRDRWRKIGASLDLIEAPKGGDRAIRAEHRRQQAAAAKVARQPSAPPALDALAKRHKERQAARAESPAPRLSDNCKGRPDGPKHVSQIKTDAKGRIVRASRKFVPWCS